MKREELRAIEGLTEEQINQIMNVHQNDVTNWNNRLQAQETQITNLNAKVKEFDGVDVAKLQKDLTDMQNKYNSDMAAKDKDFAKQMYFNGIQFTSKLAKSAAMAEFNKKNLEFKEGQFVGADEFINELKKDNPTAFVTEKSGEGAQAQTQQQQTQQTTNPFSSGMAQGSATGSDVLDPVTARFKELNPNIQI